MAKKCFIKFNLTYSFLATIVALVACCTPFWSTTSAQALGCDDVKIIFARGSGESLSDVSETAWRNSLREDLEGSTLKYSFYELGSANQGGFQYPAVEIGGLNAIGAKISAGESYEFGESVNQGVNELQAYIRQTNISCPNTKFVLGGYSQGGMVISKALNRINSDKIVYAATFGDPKLYLPEGTGWNPDACQGKNFSDYRAYVPDCHTAEGILSGLKPYQKSDFLGKLGAWCNTEDIMCGANVNMFNLLGGHTSYIAQDLYKNAADKITEKLAADFPLYDIVVPTRISLSVQDTAIVIDSTGSMSNLIDSYKAEAKRLAKTTLDRGGRIALYEYRDLLEDPNSTIKHCDFGCTYEQFVEELDKINTARGEDDDESVLGALMHVMDTLEWKQGATKSIVLLTDAGYHATDYGGITLADVTKRSLEIDPVNTYIVAPEDLRNTYDSIVNATSGKFFNTASDMVQVADYVTERPVAVLPLSQYRGAPGDKFIFDASESVSTNGIDHYEWDLDLDGVFEQTTAIPVVEHFYPSATSGFVQVKVVDKKGLVATMSAQMIVQPPETLATITGLTSNQTAPHNFEINYTPSGNTVMTVVAMDENIVGVASGHQFTLSGVERPTTITLTPYSATGIKGTSSSTTVYPEVRAPNTGGRGKLSLMNSNLIVGNRNLVFFESIF